MTSIKKSLFALTVVLAHLSSTVIKAAAISEMRTSEFLSHPLPSACRTHYATELGVSTQSTLPDIALICKIHLLRVQAINKIISRSFVHAPPGLIKTILLPLLWGDYSEQILDTPLDKPHALWKTIGGIERPEHFPIKTIAWENSSDQTPHLTRLQVKEGLVVYFFNQKDERLPYITTWHPSVIVYMATELFPDVFNAVQPKDPEDHIERRKILGETTIYNPHLRIPCPHLIVDPFLTTKVLLAWVMDHDEHPHGGRRIQIIIVEKNDLEHIAREIKNYHTSTAADEQENVPMITEE